MQSSECLQKTLTDWADLYGKKIPDRAVQVWMRLFNKTDAGILSQALDAVTKDSERMPTPGQLTKAIAQVFDQNAGTQYTYASAECSLCLGTGFHLKSVPNDPDALGYKQALRCRCVAENHKNGKRHRLSRVYADAVDPEGVPCVIDPNTGEYLYLAKDCLEGREFLAKLREVAGKKAILEPTSVDYQATDEDIPF